MAGVPTRHLPAGEAVYTSDPRGSDFGLPLVEPIHRARGRQVRVVRSVVKAQGGHVVRFTDGAKTEPLHGRTVWLRAEPHQEMP